MEKQKKKERSKKIWLLVILISILFVPAFYSFTYLKSYWDNGVAINKVPIAVVNLDQSYEKDGTTYDIGNTIVNNLKSNTTLDWKFVNYDQAKNGLYGTKYYAMIVIPKNFSEEVANATTDGFKKPQIDFYQNQGKNFIFSEISTIGVQSIQQNVSQSISKSVSNVLVQTIYKTKDGFKTAATGGAKLKNGMKELTTGSQGLASGMNKLESGSSKLNTGVQKLQSGSSSLASGVDKLQAGSGALSNGVDKLQAGSGALSDGVDKLKDGSGALVGGVDKLQNGSNSLVAGMQKLQGGSQELQAGVNKLQDGSSSLASGMQKLQAGVSGIQKGQAGITEEMQELKGLIAKGDTSGAEKLAQAIQAQSAALGSGVNSLSDGIDSAASGANQLNNGLSQTSSGMNSLSNGIDNAASGASQLNNGIASVQTGASALNNGLASVQTGANALNNGLSSVKTGANALNSGLNSAKAGANELNGGLGTVSAGMSSLNSGLSSADGGASKLNNGLKSAGTGVSALSSGLASGYKNLNDNVTFSAEQMSEFISNPVVLNTIEINPVATYGEGFAPYFICIGAWVGAMYAYFIVSALSRKFEGSFKKRFAKMFLIGAVMCAVQSLIMTVILYYGLGMTAISVPWFYAINLLSIITFYSLMNGLHYVITPIMKGAIMVLMVLQFTSCGGSYPVDVLPNFYKVISPLMPMSHCVTAIRMALSGMNYEVFYQEVFIIVMFAVGMTIIGFVVGYLRNHIQHKRVMREKSELVGEKETFNQFV